jgi:DNA polymerase-3 subunit gamma/tau
MLDIIEIDAASNRGIDNVRELIDKSRYEPSMGKWKIYIIDEVHMLTGESFNALLKTLEEPPPHVKFILATTEIEKVPETIRSRSLRFDFRKITEADIVKRLQFVAQEE